MFKKLLISIAVVASGLAAKASTVSPVVDVFASLQQSTMARAVTYGLNWTVGDKCNYNMSMAAFIQGSMEMLVREKNAEGYWLDQNMDLGFLGKQQASVLIDPNTGAIKKMIVNGKEQEPPAQGDIEVVEVKESKITVPAGTFDAVYFKAKDKKNNQEIEQWANPKAIPIMGLLKMIAPGQMGEVVQELTSFEKK